VPSVIHEFGVDALHVHPEGDVIATLPLPPAALNDAVAAVALTVQEAAACVTVTLWPATAIVPVRGEADKLAATA
jgi:hypothetical protein